MSHRLAAGVLALGLLPWLACSSDGMEYYSDAVQATRAGLVPDAPPRPAHRPAHLAELVPDAPHVALPVPAAENVGTMAGVAGVEGGAATYRIDIPVPPGRRGMQPEIALVYNSRTGSGIAGVGWTLAATSSIHRCPRTVAQDGETRGVDFSMHDRLCFDGQRLILVRGGYGQRDSEYRTELDQLARITLLGESMAREESYFRVEHASGQIAYYGVDPIDSRNAVHVPPGARAPLGWKLGRVDDPQGNAMTYRYGSSATGHVLREIRYTDTGTAPGNRRVEFRYARVRRDVPHGYRAGARSLAPLRLAEIRTHIDGTLVRRYLLRYETSGATGRALLAGIAACAHDPCRYPDTISWTELGYADRALDIATAPLAQAPDVHHDARLLGDYDGDGTRDLLVLGVAAHGGRPTERLLFLSSRGDTDAPIDLSEGAWLHGYDGANEGYPRQRDTDFDRDGVADLVGRMDGHLAIAAWNGRALVPTRSNLALGDDAAIVELADVDGDGDSDVLVRARGTLTLHRNCTERVRAHIRFCDSLPVTPLAPEEQVLRVADFDGNGLLDVAVDWNGDGDPVPARIVFTRRARDGLVFLGASIADLGGPAGSFRAREDTGLFDANGDGLLDIYRLPNQLWLNTGQGFARATNLLGTVDLHHNLHGAVFPMDIDADGREELLVPAVLVHAWCYLEHPRTEPIEHCGADFLRGRAPRQQDRSLYRWHAVRVRFDDRGRPRLVRVPTSLVAPVRAVHVEDFHGDGLPDVRYRIAHMYDEGPVGTVTVGRYQPLLARGNFVARNRGARNASAAPDLLQRVRDGLGREHAFAYAPLSSDGVADCPVSDSKPFYRVHRAAAAPHHYHFTSSMQVVARVEAPSGTGTPNATCYRYEDAMYSDEGRGFQGFRAIVAEQAVTADPEDNLRTTTRYHDAFPLTGRVRSVQVHLASDAADAPPLRETAMQWHARCERGICVPYLTEQIDHTRDLATRAVLGTTTTRTTYAARDVRYGNPTAIEVITEDAFATRVQRTDFAYDYSDADAWWLGKRVRQTVVDAPVFYKQGPVPEAADNAGKRVVTEFAWYPDDHAGRRLLQRETVQPEIRHQEQQTTYEYDEHGNPVRAWVRASFDSGARGTTWTYAPDGTFVATETNAAGHVSTLAHDPATGNLLTEERYGITTRYEYDGLGRLLTTRIASPTRDLPPVHVRRLWCDDSCPPDAIFRQVTVQDGAPIERAYIDALGRVIRTETSGFGGADIVEVAEYDAHGRLLRQSQPSHARGGAHFTEYQEHDALGRPGRQVVDRTGHAHERVITTYRYEGTTTHIERPGGLAETRTHDAAGQLVESMDAAGSATQIRHDAHGNVILIEDSAGNRITAYHDERGRRLRLTDPNGGTSTFVYNGRGELVAQTDANGHALRFRYDRLGRLTLRTDEQSIYDVWIYDRSRPGVLDIVGGHDGFVRSYAYDDLLRPTRVVTQVTGRLQFAHDYAYDTYYGRPKAVMYPDDEVLALAYDAHGYPVGEHNPMLPGEVYRRIEARTPRGQIARVRFGNGLVGTYEHVASTGQIERIQLGRDGAADRAPLQDLAYRYDDAYGNLTHREDRVTGVAETLTYDRLQRIAQVRRTWQQGRVPLAIDYAYDALGNLTRKSDFAHRYHYGDAARTNAAHAGPHAVRAIELPDGRTRGDFAYDAAGNMVAGNGRVVHYDALGRPEEIVGEDGIPTRFAYAPDGARYKQAQGDKTIFYAGGDFEYTINADGTIEKRSFLQDYAVIELTQGRRRVRYLHPDRQGSITAITNDRGEVIERHGYDAFGLPLTSEWRGDDGRLHGSEDDAQTTTRGFTGHEHLDAHRLIHMGGRIYDPRLARFLSVDPLIQDLANSQSLNPYSYVLNNPFGGTDPTGFECEAVGGDDPPCHPNADAPAGSATAPGPSDNGQQGQGVEAADSGPAVDQKGPISEYTDAPAGKAYLDERGFLAEADFMVDADGTSPGPASSNDKVGLIGTGLGGGGLDLVPDIRVSPAVAKAVQGAMILATMASGVGALRAITRWAGRRLAGIASRLGSLVSKLGRGTRGVRHARTAAERAVDIHRAVPTATQRRTTIAVTETKEGTRVISSSERQLRPAQRAQLRPGEVGAVGHGHAEITGVNAARQMGLTPTGTAASRPICRNCASILETEGITPLSPLK